MSWVKDHIRTIADHPVKGVQFRDVTTLFKDGAAFRRAVKELVTHCRGYNANKVVGIEARGFILGGAIADHLGLGFVPVRKGGKLPARTYSREYTLEYGADRLEIHMDALSPGDRVLLVDDLIATGGTTLATLELVREGGAEVAGSVFVIDLPDLGGANRLRAAGCPVFALTSYEGK